MARTHQNKDIDRALGARVRFARIEKRLSQGALGAELGISFQQVQKYELGKDRIAASQLLNIARVLEKEVAFFYEDLGEPGDTGPQLADIVDRRRRANGATSRDVKMIRALGRITDEQVKTKLYSLVETLAGPVAPVDDSVPHLQAAE